MSFFQDASKPKAKQDILELQNLGSSDIEAQINQLTSVAQGRIKNFNKLYELMNNELLSDGQSKTMDYLPSYISDAKGDLDSILQTINLLQNLQVYKQSEHVKSSYYYKLLRRQKIDRLRQTFNEMKDKLSHISQSIQTKQRKTIPQNKATQQSDDLDVHLLQEDQQQDHYDEEFVERRQKQIEVVARLMNELNGMVTDAAVRTDNIGKNILTIVKNVQDAKQNTGDAVVEMGKAVEIQKGGNKRLLQLCFLITLIVIIVVLLVQATQ
ncbi:hypothetical protein pb186bvf_015593 [Paramecium bursaria]